MQIETVKLKTLKNWEKNPRNIKKDDFERLLKQVRDLGYYKPLVVNQDNIVVGGNMRLRALQHLNFTDVEVSRVHTDGEKEMLAYALSDNDRVGSYIEQDLAELLTNIPDFNLDDFSVDLGNSTTLKKLLDQYGPSNITEDEPPELPNKAASKPGEVYELGKHRLMCGDSTELEDVEKLMNGQKADMVFTDPPYGISYVGKTKDSLTIENDRKTPTDTKDFWVSALKHIQMAMKNGGSYYICSPQGSEMMMMMMMVALRESGLNLKQTLIWVKNTLILGHSDYQYQHEVIFYGWREDSTHKFYGDRTQTSVWNINKPVKSTLHPTMKPIELCAKAIKNSSKSGDIVLDLFGGSGSTLIACEQLDRSCYMMEIDPRYCDVIRERYKNFVENKCA